MVKLLKDVMLYQIQYWNMKKYSNMIIFETVDVDKIISRNRKTWYFLKLIGFDQLTTTTMDLQQTSNHHLLKQQRVRRTPKFKVTWEKQKNSEILENS